MKSQQNGVLKDLHNNSISWHPDERKLTKPYSQMKIYQQLIASKKERICILQRQALIGSLIQNGQA